MATLKYLLDVIGIDKAADDRYCTQYWEWEQTIAKPALEALGYTCGRFYTIEKDSFGPLSRGVVVTIEGNEHQLWYG